MIDGIENVNSWVNKINKHFERCRGQVNNDKLFWDECIHNKLQADWWQLIDVWKKLENDFGHISQVRKHKERLNNVLVPPIERKLMLGAPVIRKNQKGKNFDAFRLIMQMKDLLNEIKGYEPPVEPEKLTQFETWFDK